MVASFANFARKLRALHAPSVQNRHSERGLVTPSPPCAAKTPRSTPTAPTYPSTYRSASRRQLQLQRQLQAPPYRKHHLPLPTHTFAVVPPRLHLYLSYNISGVLSVDEKGDTCTKLRGKTSMSAFLKLNPGLHKNCDNIKVGKSSCTSGAHQCMLESQKTLHEVIKSNPQISLAFFNYAKACGGKDDPDFASTNRSIWALVPHLSCFKLAGRVLSAQCGSGQITDAPTPSRQHTHRSSTKNVRFENAAVIMEEVDPFETDSLIPGLKSAGELLLNHLEFLDRTGVTFHDGRRAAPNRPRTEADSAMLNTSEVVEPTVQVLNGMLHFSSVLLRKESVRKSSNPPSSRTLFVQRQVRMKSPRSQESGFVDAKISERVLGRDGQEIEVKGLVLVEDKRMFALHPDKWRREASTKPHLTGAKDPGVRAILGQCFKYITTEDGVRYVLVWDGASAVAMQIDRPKENGSRPWKVKFWLPEYPDNQPSTNPKLTVRGTLALLVCLSLGEKEKDFMLQGKTPKQLLEMLSLQLPTVLNYGLTPEASHELGMMFPKLPDDDEQLDKV
ncbi:hypothetical protein BKA62DRAFT_788937 [Auriculariales sp. MPI-PUGE-AT-0066]|nr:hypothetical protein BKA62DRAFT_788937 [Auriculariales sp. MPI-PUGE-AT-0066]